MIVADASPLIALAQIGQLGLLSSLYGTVLIPAAVQREISPTVASIGGRPRWLRLRNVRDVERVVRLSALIHRGEAEALALALELRAVLLIDELAGRSIARASGLHVVGTLGVLLRAKQAGLIEQVAPLLAQLEAAGFWMSGSLKATILSAAGES